MRIMTRMGQVALDTLGDSATTSCRGLHSLGDLNPERRFICHFPEEQHDLERRLRLRRQRAARQEVPRAAHRAATMARDEGWMAEHMLILGLEDPEGDDHLHRRRLPQRVRQDQPRHARPAARRPGLEGLDGRRRHRLDARRRRRPPLGRQPRGRLLRRRARHQREDQPQRHGRRRAEHASSPTSRCTADGDAVVGGHGRRRRPPSADRLAGPARGRPARRSQAAHPNSRFTAPASQCPCDLAALGRPAGRADLRHHLRRPPRHASPRSSTRRSTGQHGVFVGATHGLRDDRRRHRRGRRRPPRPDGDAALLRLQHGRLLRPLARHGRAR